MYKALAPGAVPRYDTVLKVLCTLGVKLAFSTSYHRAEAGPLAHDGQVCNEHEPCRQQMIAKGLINVTEAM